MSENKLPKKVNIRKDATRRITASGIYSKEDFSRLPDFVTSIDSDVEVTFNAEKDIKGKEVITGSAKCKVTLLCMRCYETFSYTLQPSFTFIAENDEEYAKTLVEDDYIPLEFDEFGEVNLLEGIEDELILAVPLNPVMPEEECSYQDNVTYGDLDDEEEVEEKENPFAALSALKGKLKK